MKDNPDDIFTFTSGPHTASCILIGEAWGHEEAAAKRPFVGMSGKELDRILSDAGLNRQDILCTNVVSEQPPANEFTHFLAPNEVKDGFTWLHGLKAKPALVAGHRHLLTLIDRVKPKLLIAAGSVPLWALSDHATISTKSGYKLPGGITTWRGSQTYSKEISGTRYPLLPIIHPAFILRDWSARSPTVHDLKSRAARFLNGTISWDNLSRTFTMHKPNWQQIEHRLSSWYQQAMVGKLKLAVDIETYKRKWISVVGLADANIEMAVPLFYVDRKPDGSEITKNYLTLGQEQVFWELLKQLLEHPNTQICGQNFIYDTEWFHRYYNITALATFDTMVAHHLLYPGTPKRLDYLASLYCNHYIYWKDESQDWDNFPEDAERYWRYNCKDIRATYECWGVLEKVLKSEGMSELYDYQMQQWSLSRDLCLRGIAFNHKLQAQFRLELFTRANELSQWLLGAVPKTWQYTSTGKPWYDSPKGTADLFYKCCGLRAELHKDTKQPTTNDMALQALSDRPDARHLSPIFSRLRELRSIGVFISHFLDARPRADGRFVCSFNIAHPETFRWSSNSNGFGEGTNMQNLPKGDE
jgi:DNA polymerase